MFFSQKTFFNYFTYSWDTRESKKPLRSIQASEKEILSVAWGTSNENLIITGGADNVGYT